MSDPEVQVTLTRSPITLRDPSATIPVELTSIYVLELLVNIPSNICVFVVLKLWNDANCLQQNYKSEQRLHATIFLL